MGSNPTSGPENKGRLLCSPHPSVRSRDTNPPNTQTQHPLRVHTLICSPEQRYANPPPFAASYTRRPCPHLICTHAPEANRERRRSTRWHRRRARDEGCRGVRRTILAARIAALPPGDPPRGQGVHHEREPRLAGVQASPASSSPPPLERLRHRGRGHDPNPLLQCSCVGKRDTYLVPPSPPMSYMRASRSGALPGDTFCGGEPREKVLKGPSSTQQHPNRGTRNGCNQECLVSFITPPSISPQVEWLQPGRAYVAHAKKGVRRWPWL